MTVEPNAFLVQVLEHGAIRVLSTPCLARKGILRERHPMTHNGVNGLLLEAHDGQATAWCSAAEWAEAPGPPTKRMPLSKAGPSQFATPWSKFTRPGLTRLYQFTGERADNPALALPDPCERAP